MGVSERNLKKTFLNLKRILKSYQTSIFVQLIGVTLPRTSVWLNMFSDFSRKILGHKLLDSKENLKK